MLVALYLNKVSCFIMTLYKIYTMFSILKRRQYVFLTAVKKQSGIGFIFDALFGYFVYTHSLYTVVELHTNFLFMHFGRHSLLLKFFYDPFYVNIFLNSTPSFPLP